MLIYSVTGIININ